MNRKLIFVAASILVLVLGVYHLAQRGFQDVESTAGESSLRSSNEPDAGSRLTRDLNSSVAEGEKGSEVSPSRTAEPEVDGANVIRNLVKQSLDATSASSRLFSIKKLAEITPDFAAKKAKELKGLCGEDYIAAARQLGRSPALIAAREIYCEDYTEASVDGFLDELSGRPEPEGRIERIARDAYLGPQQEFRSRLESSSEGERSDVFTEMVRNASNPDQLMELISVNHQHAGRHGGVPLWTLGRDLMVFNQQANLLNAQQVAILLFSCHRFGGCGSNQYVGLVLCTNGFLGTCPPGTSVQHNLYLTTPPADFQLAQSILMRL